MGQTVCDLFPNIDFTDWLQVLSRQNSGDSEAVAADSVNLNNEEAVKIGFIGHTNVGKSSIMNVLVGEKHFSMSIRPGHTKILQTWNVSPNVQLIDTPGIIFPSYYPRQLQILSGLFPVDQVRTPFEAVGFLASRVDLVKIFQLRHISDETEFTAWDICESFAKKKNFMVARKKYPDASRGANLILRMAVSGQIVMAFVPPKYIQTVWSKNIEVKKLNELAEQEHATRRVAAVDKEKIELTQNSTETETSDDDIVPPVNNRFALLEEN